jgi:hypothetical protein
MGRMFIILGVLAAAGSGLTAGFFVGQKTNTPAEDTPKQADLKWGREIADSFLRSLVDHEGGGALDLGSPLLRERFGLNQPTQQPPPGKPADPRFIRVNAITNFYRFCGYNGYDVRLLAPMTDRTGMPMEGRNLIAIVASKGELHFRIFDNAGKIIADTDETQLKDKKETIDNFRDQIHNLFPPHELTWREKGPVVTTLVSILGVSQAPSYKDDPGRHERFTIDKEEIAPTKDEAIFRGTLSGPRRNTPFTLVVTRETDGKWRVNNLVVEDH